MIKDMFTSSDICSIVQLGDIFFCSSNLSNILISSSLKSVSMPVGVTNGMFSSLRFAFQEAKVAL